MIKAKQYGELVYVTRRTNTVRVGGEVMAKVYVVNNTNHDYSKAEQYGKLVYVTKGKLPIFKTNTVRAMLEKGLAEFTKDDYLLLSGPAIVNIMAATILYNKFDTVKFLVFDAKQQNYVVRHLSKK